MRPSTWAVNEPQLPSALKARPTAGGHGGAGTGGSKVHVKLTVWVPTVARVTVDLMNMPSLRKTKVVSLGGLLGSVARWKTCVPSGLAGSATSVPSAGAGWVLVPTVAEPDCR